MTAHHGCNISEHRNLSDVPQYELLKCMRFFYTSMNQTLLIMGKAVACSIFIEIMRRLKPGGADCFMRHKGLRSLQASCDNVCVLCQLKAIIKANLLKIGTFIYFWPSCSRSKQGRASNHPKRTRLFVKIKRIGKIGLGYLPDACLRLEV